MIQTHKKLVSLLLLFSACSIGMEAQKVVIGTYRFKKDGGEYTGEMSKRKPHGKGITKYTNGDSYEGEYVKGKRQGQGIYRYQNGEYYEGGWTQNLQNGLGTYYYLNNNKYVGLWFRNMKEGEGTMYYYNGDTYSGNWHEDERSYVRLRANYQSKCHHYNNTWYPPLPSCYETKVRRTYYY